MKRYAVVGLVAFTFLLAGCRGQFSDKPPVHLNPNMDWQAKYKAQQLTLQIPEGSVAWGKQSVDGEGHDRKLYEQEDVAFYQGKQASGEYVSVIPVKVTPDLMARGRERFDIYCAVCHTRTGNGLDSVITKRGWIVPDLRQEVTMQRSDGEIFDIASNGVRTMPGYAKQISVEDRWAIVAYVRALQKVEHGSITDLPEEQRTQLK